MDYQRIIFRKNPDLITRTIEGEVMFLASGKRVVANLYHLEDRVSRFIWGLIDGRRCVGEIIKKITEKFDAGFQEAEKDTVEFLKDLEQKKAIAREEVLNVQ